MKIKFRWNNLRIIGLTIGRRWVSVTWKPGRHVLIDVGHQGRSMRTWRLDSWAKPLSIRTVYKH